VAGKLTDVHRVLRSAKPSDNQKVAQITNMAYHDADGVTGLGYDAAGNLKGVRQYGDGDATTTTYQYTYVNGSWQQSAAVTNRGSPQVATVTQRDANGFVVGIRQPKTQAQGQGTDWIMAELNRAKVDDVRYDRTFVNDASGTAVFVSQGGYNDLGEVKSSIANPASGYQGGVTGSALSPGHVQRQLVANGEVLARYGDAPTQEENTEPSNNPVYVDTADFRMQAAQIRPRHKNGPDRLHGGGRRDAGGHRPQRAGRCEPVVAHRGGQQPGGVGRRGAHGRADADRAQAVAERKQCGDVPALRPEQ
jgi:hypothetical protein